MNYVRDCAWVSYTAELCAIIAVDIEEIKRLGKRFKKLDLDKSGSLSVDEFMSLPELQQNPLVQRVIDIFDTDGNGEVDFKGKSANVHLADLRICNMWTVVNSGEKNFTTPV